MQPLKEKEKGVGVLHQEWYQSLDFILRKKIKEIL
jgi:hypothetical protein